MNLSPDTEGQNPPLDTEDLKVLQEIESQTTKTSSALNVTSKGTTKMIAQSFRRRSPKRSLARKRRKVSWLHGMIMTHLKLTQNQMMKE